MKYIVIVEDIQDLPEVNPLVATDKEGNTAWRPYIKPMPGPPSDEIWYTTNNDEPVDIDIDYGIPGMPEILDNSYNDGKGIIKFADSVTSMPSSSSYSFTWYNLSSISLPHTITSIANNVFAHNGDESGWPLDITFNSDTPVPLVEEGGDIIDPFDMSGTYAPALTIHVPETCENTYANWDDGWKALANYIEGYNPE